MGLRVSVHNGVEPRYHVVRHGHGSPKDYQHRWPQPGDRVGRCSGQHGAAHQHECAALPSDDRTGATFTPRPQPAVRAAGRVAVAPRASLGEPAPPTTPLHSSPMLTSPIDQLRSAVQSSFGAATQLSAAIHASRVIPCDSGPEKISPLPTNTTSSRPGASPRTIWHVVDAPTRGVDWRGPGY